MDDNTTFSADQIAGLVMVVAGHQKVLAAHTTIGAIREMAESQHGMFKEIQAILQDNLENAKILNRVFETARESYEYDHDSSNQI